MESHNVTQFFAYVKGTHKNRLYSLVFIVLYIYLFIYLITSYLYLIQQNREYRHPK